MVEVIPDSSKTHWVNRAPESMRPYLQLSRLDRPVGYWLLALPGWIGLAFAGLSHGLLWTDLKWAALILIGAIAMRGAGCTYNDIVDQDLDAQVERTALRPLPAGTVTTKQAWIWLFTQCAVGLIVLLMLPPLAQIVSLLSIPLVAAYPFMKRITWFPQVWLGLTFNWAVLVAYSIVNEALNLPIFILYFGLVFWTIGYDTIYACQDTEDDALIGIKSTALKFGRYVKIAVSVCFLIFWICVVTAASLRQIPFGPNAPLRYPRLRHDVYAPYINSYEILALSLPVIVAITWQISTLKTNNSKNALSKFKFSLFVASLVLGLYLYFGFQTTELLLMERRAPS